MLSFTIIQVQIVETGATTEYKLSIITQKQTTALESSSSGPHGLLEHKTVASPVRSMSLSPPATMQSRSGAPPATPPPPPFDNHDDDHGTTRECAEEVDVVNLIPQAEVGEGANDSAICGEPSDVELCMLVSAFVYFVILSTFLRVSFAHTLLTMCMYALRNPGSCWR